MILLIRTKKKRQGKVSRQSELSDQASSTSSDVFWKFQYFKICSWRHCSADVTLDNFRGKKGGEEMFISVVLVFYNDGFRSWRADCLQNHWCLVKHIHVRCRRGKEVSGTGFEFRCRSLSKQNFRYSLTHFSFFIAKQNRVFLRNKKPFSGVSSFFQDNYPLSNAIETNRFFLKTYQNLASIQTVFNSRKKF